MEAINKSFFNTWLSLILTPGSILEGEGILIHICLLTMQLWTNPLFLVSISQVFAYKFTNKSIVLKCSFQFFYWNQPTGSSVWVVILWVKESFSSVAQWQIENVFACSHHVQMTFKLVTTLMITSKFSVTMLHSLQPCSPQQQGHVVTNVSWGDSVCTHLRVYSHLPDV